MVVFVHSFFGYPHRILAISQAKQKKGASKGTTMETTVHSAIGSTNLLSLKGRGLGLRRV